MSGRWIARLIQAGTVVACAAGISLTTLVPSFADDPPLADVAREDTVIVGSWVENAWKDTTLYNPFAIGSSLVTGNSSVWEGLAYWNAFKDETVFWQASGYEYNDDFTELTIHLRPEVKWSDGEPFTAEDVVFTLQSLIDLSGKVRFSKDLADITESVEATDDHTVVIKMKAPAPRYFFNFFTWKWNAGAFPIVPKHIFEGEDFATFQNFDLQNKWPITTGPFNVVASNAQQKIFDTRDDWWGATSGLNQPLPFKRLVFLAAGTDQTVRTQMVVNGDIDITVLAPAAAISAIQQSPDVTFHSGREPPYGYEDTYTQQLFVPTQTAPFNSADLRWAISYYLDREQIVSVAWMDTTAPAPVPYPDYAGLKKYTDSIPDLLATYNTVEYNPAKGDERMQAAGYTKNADGMWVDASGTQLKLAIYGWDEWDATGEIVVEQLRRAGIEATYSDPPDAADQLARAEYNAMIADGAQGAFRDPYEALVPFTCARTDPSGVRVVGGNKTQWCNAEFDELVDQMARIDPTNEAALMPLYRQAMEIWLPNLPSIPTFEWMHNIAMVTKYWDCWPTVDGKLGEYVNEQPRLLGFGVVLRNLCRAESN